MFGAQVVRRGVLAISVLAAALLTAAASSAANAPVRSVAGPGSPARAPAAALRAFPSGQYASAARTECHVAADPVQPGRWLRARVGRRLALYGALTCNETMGSIELQTCGQRKVGGGNWQWVRKSCVPRITRITKYNSATARFKGYRGVTYRTYTLAIAHPLGSPELVYRGFGDPYRCCSDVGGPH